MTTQHPLSAHDMRMLVPIRLALETALLQARAAGPYRYGAALVALDAVVERAVNLCVSRRGLPLSQKLDDNISKLCAVRELGWKPKLLPQVRLLRKARNSAQHDGIEPDRELVPTSASNTEVFVVELLHAQYGVDIRTVTLSQAILDPDLRASFAKAEEARAVGELHDCIQRASLTYSAAVRKWNSLRSRRSTLFGANEIDREVRESFANLETAFDATTFVGDVGAAEWFVALQRDGNNDVFDDEDAARALAFVFSWITGYESTVATWTEHRGRRKAIAARHERLGSAPAEIRSATAAVIEPGSGMIKVTFVIGNVPSVDEYDDWAQALNAQLRNESRPNCSVNSDGTVRITRPISQSSLVRSDADALAAALEAVEGRVAAERSAKQAAKDARATAARKMTEAATAVRDQWPSWVLDLQGRSSEFSAPAWELRLDPAVLRLQLLDGENARHFDVRNLLLEQSGVEQCSYTSVHSLLLSPSITVDEMLSVLYSADAVVSAALRRRRDLNDSESTVLLGVNSALADALLRAVVGRQDSRPEQ